jgi:UTP--glucose-1-phosphate uridylyltransferase
MSKKVRKVVFPVGGFGTRFLPATKSIPKEMLPVVDKPIIHYAFEEAASAGIEQFIFVTGRNKNTIDNHFDHSYELQTHLYSKNKQKELAETMGWLPPPGSIMFTRQQHMLGLGHAIWCARHMVGDEPFAVILADDMVLAKTPCLKQMMGAYKQTGGNVLGVAEVPRAQTSSYGIVNIDKKAKPGKNLVKAKGLVEKPEPAKALSTLSIIGRYILQPEIFNVLERLKPGAGGEIQLTDAINAMIGKQDVFGFQYEGTRYDCGNQLGYVSANMAYALKRDDLGKQVRETMKTLLKEGK